MLRVSTPCRRRTALSRLARCGMGAAWLTALPQLWSQDADDSAAVDRSLVRGLAFLRSVQVESGGWRLQDQNECAGVTSLSVLSFLAVGHTAKEGPYAETIRRGVAYVLQHQDGQGLIASHRGHGPMYGHGISALMLAEASGTLGDDDLNAACRRGLERAIALILKSQMARKGNRHAGGWRYHPGANDSDLSVTCWQLLALRAARDIGCDVPAEPIELAVRYVQSCASQSGFAYQPGGGATPSMTGAGLTALLVCGETDLPETRAAIRFLVANPVRRTTNYFYYTSYYSSLGLHKVGGDVWSTAGPELRSQILGAQEANGSWQVQHGHEAVGGPVYATSMAILALAVDYGYLPIYQR